MHAEYLASPAHRLHQFRISRSFQTSWTGEARHVTCSGVGAREPDWRVSDDRKLWGPLL